MPLASIQKIHSITNHPDPEVARLDCAKVFDWPIVVGREQFKEGELIVFIEIDSVVPDAPAFEFMRGRKFKVWNGRFKGAASSGLAMPLSILPAGEYKEGDDVTETLGVIKYERPLDTTVGGSAKGNFPTALISISDETNMLGCRKSVYEEIHGKECVITEKADGSSTTFIFNNGEFQACSRRFVMRENSGFPWQAAVKYDIKAKLEKLGRNLAIQAESIGPKLNGNSMGLPELEIRVFRAKDLDSRRVLTYDELVALCKELDLPMAKTLNAFVFDKEIHTPEYFRAIADALTWQTNGKPAEGIVIAPTSPFYSPTLQKEWSVKVISQRYS